MLKICRLAAASLAVSVGVSGTVRAAEDVQLTKGRLTHVGSYAIQTIAAVNNTGRNIELLQVECGFFLRGELIRSGGGAAQNVSPGQRAYFDVRSDDASDADSTDCRVMAALPQVQAAAEKPVQGPSWDEVLALRAVTGILVTLSAVDHAKASGKPAQTFLDIMAKASADAVNTAGIAGTGDAEQIRQAAAERVKEMFAGIHF
jgi:hypothetical protein